MTPCLLSPAALIETQRSRRRGRSRRHTGAHAERGRGESLLRIESNRTIAVGQALTASTDGCSGSVLFDLAIDWTVVPFSALAHRSPSPPSHLSLPSFLRQAAIGLTHTHKKKNNAAACRLPLHKFIDAAAAAAAVAATELTTTTTEEEERRRRLMNQIPPVSAPRPWHRCARAKVSQPQQP